MGFFDYRKAVTKFKDNNYVLDTITRLKDFDEFHCLRNSNLLLAGKISDIIPKAPMEYIKWMSICNGGLLFDTTLLCVSSLDEQIGVEFSALNEYNTSESYKEYNLPDGYAVIAVRSYGDPICVSKSDNRVYLWDCEEMEFTEIWRDFYNFLADEVDTAIELIANEDLEPIPLKMNEDA